MSAEIPKTMPNNSNDASERNQYGQEIVQMLKYQRTFIWNLCLELKHGRVWGQTGNM